MRGHGVVQAEPACLDTLHDAHGGDDLRDGPDTEHRVRCDRRAVVHRGAAPGLDVAQSSFADDSDNESRVGDTSGSQRDAVRGSRGIAPVGV